MASPYRGRRASPCLLPSATVNGVLLTIILRHTFCRRTEAVAKMRPPQLAASLLFEPAQCLLMALNGHSATAVSSTHCKRLLGRPERLVHYRRRRRNGTSRNHYPLARSGAALPVDDGENQCVAIRPWIAGILPDPEGRRFAGAQSQRPMGHGA